MRRCIRDFLDFETPFQNIHWGLCFSPARNKSYYTRTQGFSRAMPSKYLHVAPDIFVKSSSPSPQLQSFVKERQEMRHGHCARVKSSLPLSSNFYRLLWSLTYCLEYTFQEIPEMQVPEIELVQALGQVEHYNRVEAYVAIDACDWQYRGHW